MAIVNSEEIKKLRRGELFGNIALGVCAVAAVWFIIGFTVARLQEIKALGIAVLVSAPVLLVAGIAAAAYCNIKYGGAISAVLRGYVRDICVENAANLHPERDSLTFRLTVDGACVNLQTNGYKEKIAFDFSEFGKATLARKISALNEIENRLCATFCRLYERGANYTEVSYTESEGTRKKSGKPVYIIKEGQPDKNAYKNYLKNK